MYPGKGKEKYRQTRFFKHNSFLYKYYQGKRNIKGAYSVFKNQIFPSSVFYIEAGFLFIPLMADIIFCLNSSMSLFQLVALYQKAFIWVDISLLATTRKPYEFAWWYQILHLWKKSRNWFIIGAFCANASWILQRWPWQYFSCPHFPAFKTIIHLRSERNLATTSALSG